MTPLVDKVRPPRKEGPASSTTPTAGLAYVIDVNDILPFAMLVVHASQEPTPAMVLKNLHRTITSRRRFTEWYQSQNSNDHSLERSNNGHKHFNGVLEGLLNILASSHLEGQATVTHEPVAESEGVLDSSPAKQNPFDTLELESLALVDQDEDLATVLESVPSPKPDTSSPQTETTYQFQDSTADLQFAIFKMFADLHQVRKHIHECLERYRGRNLNLLSVAATINCAIGIVRGIEREFMDSVPQFTSWETVMDTIVSPSQFEELSTGSLKYSETAYLRSIYCLPFEELRRFRESFVTGKKTKHLYGHVLMSRLDGSQIDNEDSWKAEKIILQEFFVEVLSLGFSISLPVEDVLIRGVTEVYRDNPVHLWVVFGLQIFLDTQAILGIALPCVILSLLTVLSGEEVTRPFREFKASSEELKKNVENCIKYSEVIIRKHYDQTKRDFIRKNSALLSKWAIDDMFMQLRKLHLDLGPGRPFFFLSHNPVACGLLQCATLLKSQSLGITIVNTLTFIASAAHIYNAARNECRLPTRWPDMETLIHLYGRHDLFLGEPPKNIAAYRRHHLIVGGVAATSFASKSGERFDYSDKGARQLTVPEIMGTLDRFLCPTDATDTDINVDLMEKFLHQTARRNAVQKKGSTSILSSVQLLMLLEKCIKDEEAKLVFNYYTFHESCWRLLFNIYVELRAEFMAWLPAHRSGENPNFLLLVDLPQYIFNELCRTSGKKNAGKDDILSRAGRVMDVYISKKASNPIPTTVGVVNDEGLETEIEHGTQNGQCIHWGVCDRLKGVAQG